MIAIFPKLAGCAAQGDVEQLVCLVRQYFGKERTYAPRLDVRQIFDAASIPIEVLAFEGRGALIVRDEKGRFETRAVIRGGIAREIEERFLLAHLLGHFFLHAQPLIARGDWAHSGFKETDCPLTRYERELEGAGINPKESSQDAEADEFAAALLLPSGMLTRAVEKLGDLQKVAQFFGVTRALLERRLERIGLGESRPVSFLDAERKLHASERPERGPLKSPAPFSAKVTGPADATEARTKVKQTLARASYREQVKQQSSESEAPPRASNGPVAAFEEPVSGKGMDRIRALARMLDRSIDSDK